MEPNMFTLGVVMLFCIVQSSSALKCYTCDSDSDPGCVHLTDKRLQPNVCSGMDLISGVINIFAGNVSTTNCVKVVGTNKRVKRGCLVEARNVDLCSLKFLKDFFPENWAFCGACRTDGCNSGNSMQLFSNLMVFCAMVCTVRLFV